MKMDYREMQDGFFVELSYDKQKDSTENVTGNVRRQLIVKMMTEDPKISTTYLAKQLNITRMTLHRDIEKLKTEGVIERIGPDKGGYWQINKK